MRVIPKDYSHKCTYRDGYGDGVRCELDKGHEGRHAMPIALFQHLQWRAHLQGPLQPPVYIVEPPFRCDECGGALWGYTIFRLEDHKSGCPNFPL